MAITLTEWWQALEADLTRLKDKNLLNDQMQQWNTATTMFENGKIIEGFVSSWRTLLAAKTAGDKIEKAAINLGAESLPDVNSLEELVFAIAYYQHLGRYSDIQSVAMVQSNLDAKAGVVATNKTTVEGRITTYIQANEDAIRTQFPDINNYPGDSLFNKLDSMVAGNEPQAEVQAVPIIDNKEAVKSLEKKLLKQFETDLSQFIGDPNQILSISEAFDALNTKLSEKESNLLEIAQSKKMIEDLNSGHLALEDSVIQNEYPEVVANWKNLITVVSSPKSEITNASANLDEDDLFKQAGVQIARAGIATIKAPFQAASFVASYTIGWITPKIITNMASGIANKVGGYVDALTPTANVDRKKELKAQKEASLKASKQESELCSKAMEAHKKELLVDAIQQTIVSTVKKLGTANDVPEAKISSKDFATLSSKQVSDLADKVALVSKITHLKEAIVLFQAKQNKGIVTVTKMDVFGAIVKYLSKTVFRNFIYDTILLTLEAEKLQKKLDEIILNVDTGDQFNKTDVSKHLNDALTDTKSKFTEIQSQSFYRFFDKDKQERVDAANELTTVVDKIVRL
jgi:hypothetical protein